MHAYRKDNIFMKRRLWQSFTFIWKWSKGPKAQRFFVKMESFNIVYIDEANTTLDIFFSLRECGRIRLQGLQFIAGLKKATCNHFSTQLLLHEGKYLE